jgi:hypothetical protein
VQTEAGRGLLAAAADDLRVSHAQLRTEGVGRAVDAAVGQQDDLALLCDADDEAKRSLEETEKARGEDAPQPAHAGGDEDKAAEGEPLGQDLQRRRRSFTTDDDA